MCPALVLLMIRESNLLVVGIAAMPRHGGEAFLAQNHTVRGLAVLGPDYTEGGTGKHETERTWCSGQSTMNGYYRIKYIIKAS